MWDVVEAADVCGVDGCRAGWVVATRTECRVVEHLDDTAAAFAVIGVDMPIGLPETPPRSSDGAARRFLAPRGSTIFPTPPRALVHHTDYATANAASKERFGCGLSRQAFGLFPKMREVDALAAAVVRDRLVEIHPECAFARMAGAPLPPKRTAEGRQLRGALVRTLVGIDVAGTRVRGAAAHDVLDACAVLWSARRFAAGTAVTFGDGAVDARGLPMRIVS